MNSQLTQSLHVNVEFLRNPDRSVRIVGILVELYRLLKLSDIFQSARHDSSDDVSKSKLLVEVLEMWEMRIRVRLPIAVRGSRGCRHLRAKRVVETTE
jgi:hypothetical protein